MRNTGATNPPITLDDETIASYRRNGFVAVRNVLPCVDELGMSIGDSFPDDEFPPLPA